MSDAQNIQNGEAPAGTRVYLTGSCDGFDTLREALAQQPDLRQRLLLVGIWLQVLPAVGEAEPRAMLPM